MGLRRLDVAGGTRGAPLAALVRRALTSVAAFAAIVTAMNPPHSQSEEIFHRLLDESAARLAVPESAGIAIPDDDLHCEIIVPLLPAMLGDKSIRQHWSEQAATGFPARLARHFENGEPAPRWLPGDFEIHVTASYSAGADARALADTLLSEDSLRDMTAALMNQLLDVLWPSLAPAPIPIPEEPRAEAGIFAGEITTPAAEEIPEPIIPPEPEAVPVPPADVAAEILPPVEIARENFWHAEEHVSAALVEPVQITAPDAVQQFAAQSEALPGDESARDFSQPAAAMAESLPVETSAHGGGDPLRGLKVWRGRLGDPAISKRYSRAMW